MILLNNLSSGSGFLIWGRKTLLICGQKFKWTEVKCMRLPGLALELQSVPHGGTVWETGQAQQPQGSQTLGAMLPPDPQTKDNSTGGALGAGGTLEGSQAGWERRLWRKSDYPGKHCLRPVRFLKVRLSQNQFSGGLNHWHQELILQLLHKMSLSRMTGK